MTACHGVADGERGRCGSAPPFDTGLPDPRRQRAIQPVHRHLDARPSIGSARRSTGASRPSTRARTSSPPDVFFDLLPPFWRFQLKGPSAFAAQLRAIAGAARSAPGCCASCRPRPASSWSTRRPQARRGGPAAVALRGARRPHHRGRSATATAAGTPRCGPGTPPRRRCCGRDGAGRGDDTPVDHRAPVTATRCSPPPDARPDDRRPRRRGRGGPPAARRPARRARAAGCFRMLLPRSHGGARRRPAATALRVFEALARADASVAWTVMIGGSAWIDLAGLPRATFDELFGPAATSIVAGVFAPTGSITPVDGGYRVTGRWGFASGCEHADVLYANCVEGIVDGVPQLRIAVFAPDEVADRGHLDGGRACAARAATTSGSPTCVVPAERTLPCRSTTSRAWTSRSSASRLPTLIALMIASVAVGIAQGALDDARRARRPQGAAARRRAAGRRPVVPGRSGAPPTPTCGQSERCCTSRRRSCGRRRWQASRSPCAQRAQARAAAVWATMRAAAVVETAYRAAAAPRSTGPAHSQRRLRDIHTLTQHFLVRQNTMTTAGAVLAGQDVNIPVF